MSKRPLLAAAIAAIGLVFSTIPAHAEQGSAPAAGANAQLPDRPPVATMESVPFEASTPPGTAPTVTDETEPAASTATAATAEDIQSATPLADDPPALGQVSGTPVDAAVATAPQDRQADLPHDLSPWGMFMAADMVVKAVMIGLAVASVATWTVLMAKIIELGAAQRAVGRAVRDLTAAQGLAAAEAKFAGRRDTPAQMLIAAREEMDSSDTVLDQVSDTGVKERVASRLQRMEVQAGRRIAKGTGLLATIGSTAPFVGLFGTVWGIMNSFIGISKAQTTNLAIVAPGIAEALLATAIGLVAAIPAVVIYNFLARAITGYRQGLTDASAAIERLASRDLDRRRAKLATHRAAGTTRADPTLVRIG